MKRLLLAAALILAALTGQAAAQKTLVIAIAADPTGFDPEAVQNNTSGFIMATIFDSLVKYKPGSVDVEPGLAEKWDISEDGLTYTFHLRKGVTFHDGTPFNGPNYVKTIKRLLHDLFPPDRRLSILERQKIAERTVKAIYIHSHMDEENFDVARVMKCPVGVPQEDGGNIPTCSYNVLYREKDERFADPKMLHRMVLTRPAPGKGTA